MAAADDRAHADAVSAGRDPTAPSACDTQDACMDLANGLGNADASRVGLAIYATRSSPIATSTPILVKMALPVLA